MAITTYRNNKNAFVTDDKDFNEILPKANEAAHGNFYIERYLYKLLFKKPFYLYSLFFDLGSEYQIVNFYGENTSINTSVSKQVIIAYLTGIQGAHIEKK